MCPSDKSDDMITWKDIPHYEGIYEASTDGKVRTVNGKTTFTKHHGVRHWKQKELSQSWHSNGYMVTLYKNGKPRKLLVARIVASTFLENLLDTNMTVNHKDGNRKNNSISNLEWLTRHDNIKHGFDTGLYPTRSICIMSQYGEVKSFPSMSSASKFLGRDNRYVSMRNKQQSELFSVDNTKYFIIQTGNYEKGNR